MRDQKTEDALTKRGHAWEYKPSIQIASIDMVGARINPARIHRKIDPDVVNKYGVFMLEGVDFPAIVVFDVGSPLLELCTGLHRLEAAHDAKRVTIDCYVVMEPSEAKRHLLTGSINSIEGRAPDHAEDLRAAVEEYRLNNAVFSVADVARNYGLTEGVLTSAIRSAAADKRAMELGILDQFCGLPGYLKEVMARISIDTTFVRATKLIADYGLRGSEAEGFIKDVAKTRSEAAGFAAVEKKEKELAARERSNKARLGRTASSKSTKFLSKGREMLRMGPVQNLGLDGIDPANLEDAIEVQKQLIALHSAVHKAMQTRLDQIERKNKWEASQSDGARSYGPTSLHV